MARAVTKDAQIETKESAVPEKVKAVSILPGLLLVLALALAGRFLAHRVGIFPDVVLAMLGGIVINNALSLPKAVKPGITFSMKYLLRTAIILLGSTLSAAAIVKNGVHTIILILALFLTAMALGLLLARVFRLTGVIGLLIGAGTAICGGTAILALSPLARAREEETAYAIATIFSFNIIALLLYPVIGHALHLSQTAFGSWAGTAVNDTSVVIATGYVYGHAAGSVATVVKLTRTLLLVPLAVIVGLRYASTSEDAGSEGILTKARHVMPWFILGFVAMAILNSMGLIPHAIGLDLSALATFLIVMVLAAVGLSVNLREMARLGARPVTVGLLLASVMGGLSLGLIHILAIG